MDKFSNSTKELSDPASEHFAITPSDSVKFAISARAIYVGGDGNIAVVSNKGTVVLYKGAKAGSIIPIRCKRVNATNTTATDLVGLY